MIGANCLIGNYAFIRPGTIISNGVKIGFATEIKNAVIEDGTYQSGQQVPIQIHVHSVTSDTDIDVVGHLNILMTMRCGTLIVLRIV